MQIIGKITQFPTGDYRIEFPILGLTTGYAETREEIELVAIDLVVGLGMVRFNKTMTVSVIVEEDKVYVSTDDVEILLALIIAKQRSTAGLTLSQMQKKTHQKSTGAISKYESGDVEPGISKLTELLSAMNIDIVLDINERIEPTITLEDPKKDSKAA